MVADLGVDGDPITELRIETVEVQLGRLDHMCIRVERPENPLVLIAHAR
jgi:hypothetical protein